VTSFKVLYSYEKRKGVPDAKSGSRPLCDKCYTMLKAQEKAYYLQGKRFRTSPIS
jgi:hypothetical protein